MPVFAVQLHLDICSHLYAVHLQMLKRYSKQETPAWDRKLTVVLGSLFAITLLLFAVWAVVLFANWAEVDDCLDSGGSYDYEEGRCDFGRNHPGPDRQAR